MLPDYNLENLIYPRGSATDFLCNFRQVTYYSHAQSSRCKKQGSKFVTALQIHSCVKCSATADLGVAGEEVSIQAMYPKFLYRLWGPRQRSAV